MRRRGFIKGFLGVTALGLYGCGSSSGDIVATQTGASTTQTSQKVVGTIDSALGVVDPVVGSSFGPATVQGTQFRTTISGTGVGLLALEDGQGGVFGFTLTFPGESPTFNFENTALAILFMEPGFLALEIESARERSGAAKILPAFHELVRYLSSQAGTRLDFLSGEPDFQAAVDNLVSELGSPIPEPADPYVVLQAPNVVLVNPSPRFLQVTRNGEPLDQLLPAYGTLIDSPPPGAFRYVFEGPGSNGSVFARTFVPTVFFAAILPLLELALGDRIDAQRALDYLATLSVESPFLGQSVLDTGSTTLVTEEKVIAEIIAVAEAISEGEPITELFRAADYIGGLEFSAGAILKFKQHQDNPTPIPIGTPIALVFIVAAITFLPDVVDVTGVL